MGCIFGYLVVVIFVKWFINWNAESIQAPSLINMLIGMFLSPGNVPADKQIYAGQGMIQAILLVVAFLSLPVLLLPKPLLLLREHKQKMRRAQRLWVPASSGDADESRGLLADVPHVQLEDAPTTADVDGDEIATAHEGGHGGHVCI